MEGEGTGGGGNGEDYGVGGDKVCGFVEGQVWVGRLAGGGGKGRGKGGGGNGVMGRIMG